MSRRPAQLRLAAILLVIVGMATNCNPAGPATVDSHARTIVRVNLTSEPASLSLIGKSDRYGEILAAQITDSLLTFDADLNLVPQLAESWEISEADRSILFRLRRGVLWHDGTPVTARDVIFTVEKVRDPVSENRSFLPSFADVVKTEAIDDLTLRVTYSRLTPDMLEGWRVPIVPAHLLEGQDLLTGPFQNAPIGCGPFRFVHREPGQRIELAANPDYWDGAPRIDRLVFRIYPDQRTAYQALLKGDLDLMNLTPDLWRLVTESEDADRFTSYLYPRLSAWVLAWNQDGSNPFFTDARVRKALIHALDRQEFSDTIAKGAARPGATTYSMLPNWNNPQVLPLQFDLDLARSLLDQAGWADTDGDGVRDRDGVPFRFKFTYPASAQQLTHQMAAWQKESWAKIGVEVELQTLEWGTFRDLRNAHRFEAVAFSLGLTPSPDQRNLYHSSFRDDGFNHFGLNDPEVDRLTTEGQNEFDPIERRRIFNALQVRLAELEPLSCLFQFSAPGVYDKRLKGVTPSPIDHWRIDAGPARWWWDLDG